MPPFQEVVSLPLPPGLRNKLLAAGFRTLADLDSIGPVDLSKEANITSEEALEVLRVSASKVISSWKLSGAVSAVDLYEAQKNCKKVITFCSVLDQILGGGVYTGQVTEFCGVPGVGKTQLGIQLAVDVQIPSVFGGVGGAAVYIDTEGGFMIERVQDIACAAAKHISQVAAKSGKPNMAPEAQRFTLDTILSNIFYFRVHDSTEQVSSCLEHDRILHLGASGYVSVMPLALVNMLDQFLEHQPQVKLIVVDSITFHFRQDFKDMAQRTRILTQMAQDFMKIAESRGIAVVFMNQVTTKVLEDRNSKLVPALGESWGHAASTRVILYWQNNDRHAYIYKSPCHPPATAVYTVTSDGVRGVKQEKRPAEPLPSTLQPASRPRLQP